MLKESKLVLPCGTACVWCLGPRGNSSFAWRCECLAAEKTDQMPANQIHGAQTQKIVQHTYQHFQRRNWSLNCMKQYSRLQTIQYSRFIMNESISESDQHGRDVTAWCFCKADLVQSCFYGTYACALDTCMAAMNCAWFSISSSAPFLWTLLNTELLKKNLQFWWRIWKSSSNISAFTSGQERCRTQRRRSAKYKNFQKEER